MPGPAPPDPHLHDGPVAVNLQHLAAPHLSIAEFQVHDLAVDGSLHTVDNHQGSSNGRNGLVLCEAETQAGSAHSLGQESSAQRTKPRRQQVVPGQRILDGLHGVHGAPHEGTGEEHTLGHMPAATLALARTSHLRLRSVAP